MRPPPCLSSLYLVLAAKVTRVLPAPLLLTRTLAGHLTFRRSTELLVVGIAWMRLEPNLTLATLSQSFRAHCLLPAKSGRIQQPRPAHPYVYTHHHGRGRCNFRERKKEEDDPFGSGSAEKKTNLSDRRKKSHFKAAFTPMRLKPLPMPVNSSASPSAQATAAPVGRS